MIYLVDDYQIFTTANPEGWGALSKIENLFILCFIVEEVSNPIVKSYKSIFMII